MVDTLSGGLPGAVSAGGAMMTPMAAFGMDGAFYLMLEIQAPEGTVLPPLDGENETYQLFGDDIFERRVALSCGSRTAGTRRSLIPRSSLGWRTRILRTTR